MGAGYDKYLAEIADLIVASGHTRNLPFAMRELFPLRFEFHVSRDAALRRIRELWKKNGPELLQAAEARVANAKMAAAKQKADLLLMEAAHKLLQLSKVKLSPISKSADFGITAFMPAATPEDYKANPMVPLLMSFGEFQVGYERSYVEQNRKEQREAALGKSEG
jgi:hypothetical protein